MSVIISTILSLVGPTSEMLSLNLSHPLQPLLFSPHPLQFDANDKPWQPRRWAMRWSGWSSRSAVGLHNEARYLQLLRRDMGRLHSLRHAVEPLHPQILLAAADALPQCHPQPRTNWQTPHPPSPSFSTLFGVSLHLIVSSTPVARGSIATTNSSAPSSV